MTIGRMGVIERMGFETGGQFTTEPFGKRTRYNGVLYKSNGELAFAKLLDILYTSGQITEWKYEPEAFWFEGIRRGTVSYKPDFRANWKKEGRVYYEVKRGRITGKDITKWKRMSNRHPTIKLVLVWADPEPKPRKRDGKANPKWQRIQDGSKYLHHVWYIHEDLKKAGIKI